VFNVKIILFKKLFSVEMLLDCVQSGRRFGSEVKQALEAAILAGITRDRLPM